MKALEKDQIVGEIRNFRLEVMHEMIKQIGEASNITNPKDLQRIFMY